MTDLKQFDCFCRKCGTTFVSENQMDTDGDGLCPPCKERTAQIALQVQKQIDINRRNRPPVPKREVGNMPGTRYINSRDLLL